MSNPQWFKYAWVWNKVNRITGYLDAKKRPLRVVEDILVFCKEQNIYNPQMTPGKYFGTMPASKKQTKVYGKHEVFRTSDGTRRYPLTLLTIPGDERGTVGRIHPTQKPVALLEYLIKTYTNEGDTVLDFTMGSGTTGVACVNTNRHFIGVEKDAGYFEIGKNRIEQTRTQPMFA
jgi:DNA modification methylase